MAPGESLFSLDVPNVLDTARGLKIEFRSLFDKGFGDIEALVEQHKFALMDLLDVIERTPDLPVDHPLRKEWDARTTERTKAEKWLEAHEEVAALVSLVEATKIDIHHPLVAPFWNQFMALKRQQWAVGYQAEQELKERDATYFAAEHEYEST